MNIIEELRSGGAIPSGPVSAWPQERNQRLLKANQQSPNKVKASAGKMAKGFLKTAGQAMRHGRTSEEIRNERYETCKSCEFFIADSKRCSECGCFMEAKTWIGGDPNMLCPKQKWSR